MKFDYPGGVLPEERAVIERFEDEIIPYIERNGSRIGDAAMKGDLDAEEVIRKYAGFVNGMPQFRELNFRSCVRALKRWETKARQ